MRTTKGAVVLAAALLAAMLAVGVAWAAPGKTNDPTLGASAKLRKAVEPAGILVHERNFARAARLSDPDEDGIGTRASGNEGYDASADYVANKLEAAGYEVTRQEFEFPYFDVLSESFSQTEPEEREFEPYDGLTGDYDVMTYSGSGSVEDALVVPTNDVVFPPSDQPSSTSGCQPEDFAPASETEDQVALIQRGGCDFVVKAENAEAAGYDAAIVFNEGQEDVPDDDRVGVVLGTLGKPGTGIPVFGISFALGQELYEADGARVSLDIQTESEIRATENVIADSAAGREDRTIVVGAHLDSVPEGP